MNIRSTSRYIFPRVYLFLFLSLSLKASILDDIGPIMPSVLQGACTVCGATSCANCSKISATPVNLAEGNQSTTCFRCDNKGPFCSAPSVPSTVFIPRSQGANTARELAGWEEFIHQYDVGEYYLTTGQVLGFYHSFRPERIARSLFGSSALHFSGSQVPGRGRCELLADNFGLSPYFQGSVFFHPTISNIVFDNQFFIGLDPWACGLYARIHAPLVHTRWNLKMRQVVEAEPLCGDFPACYMGPDEAPASCDAIDALNGQRTFGAMQQPWHYGRFRNCAQTLTRLADIDLILGYNIWQSDNGHAGFYVQAVAPTGNKPTGRFIFEPIVGNAKHWELGLGFSGHWVLWEKGLEHNLAVYVEGNVTHMFRNTQTRSFDFCNYGPLNRYMLLKEFESVNDSLVYTGNLIPGINVATRPVHVSIPLKGDISAKLCYRSPCFIVDLGYNFYGKMKERIHFLKSTNTKLYGIKGTEGTCGLEYATVGNPAQFGPLVGKISLNSTQSQSSLLCVGPTDNLVAVSPQNPGDIVVTAFSRQTGEIDGTDVLRAFDSAPPVLLNVDNLDKRTGQMPAEATHKVFGYLGYNFYQADWCYNPYIGIGGELEFDARSCAERTALNQWGVWLKGGFEF